MKKAVRGIMALGGVGVAAWLGLGGCIWSRNRIPALTFPPETTLPQGNVYNDYVQCVRSVQQSNAIAALTRGGVAEPKAAQQALQANAELLQRLHTLTDKPSVVTQIQTGTDYVPAVLYPNITKLLVLAARPLPGRDALRKMQDGFAFAEGVMRGGATLHLTTGYLSYVPLFEAFPALLPKLSADEARAGADALRAHLGKRTSLAELVQNERRVQLKRLVSTIPDPMRGFKFQFGGYSWDYLMKPKSEAVAALDTYFTRWSEEAAKPIGQVSPPEAPTATFALLSDDAFSPEQIGKQFLRHHYLEARLRLIYAALKLEAIRKQTGQYPALLAESGSDPLLTDPFSGKPLIYQRDGAGYRLYSVGPNGRDDGGKPFKEGKMAPDSSGDLLLQPNF
jgi:hypothetical protein